MVESESKDSDESNDWTEDKKLKSKNIHYYSISKEEMERLVKKNKDKKEDS